jgi:hypothetical protein
MAVDTSSGTMRRVFGRAVRVGHDVAGRDLDDAADRFAAALTARLDAAVARLGGRAPEAVADVYRRHALTAAEFGGGVTYHDHPVTGPAYAADLDRETAAALAPGRIAARPAGWGRNWGDGAHAREIAGQSLYATYGRAADAAADLHDALDGLVREAILGDPVRYGCRPSESPDASGRYSVHVPVYAPGREALADRIAPRIAAAVRAHYAPATV